MTWEQKLVAMKVLCGEVSLEMRKPGDWYVRVRCREVKYGDVLESTGGNGATPEEAVNDDWRELVEELSADRFIVINAYGGSERRAVRWNGFMWETLSETQQKIIADRVRLAYRIGAGR